MKEQTILPCMRLGNKFLEPKQDLSSAPVHAWPYLAPMTPNEQIIERFYTAFFEKDFRSMQALYAENATFGDPVFPHLNCREVRAMWQMFCKRGVDLQVSFTAPKEIEGEVTTRWTAHYTFSKSRRQVTNQITARFVIKDGLILRHTDDFDFSAWAKQALGFKGWLWGRTYWLRTKVQRGAMEGLSSFMTANDL